MEIAGKRFLLIGGAGLVGSYIAERLIADDVAEVVIFDNFVRGQVSNLARVADYPKVRIVHASIEKKDTVRREMDRIDGLFLLASLWLGECISNPRNAWEINVLGTWNVVEAACDAGVKRLVYSSSASVYGNAVFTPMTEAHPLDNRTTYGATKIANEQMLRAMNEQHKLPYIGLRYMNIYGPRMDYQGTYVSVIMKVLDRIFVGKAPIIFGDGSQVYDFVYVEDVADANILGMKADCTDEFFNIGSGVGTSINELVETLLKLSGSDLAPEYQPQEQSFVTRRIGSTEKAERLLGFKAKTPLVEGLKRVVEWRQGLKKERKE
jgi:UDP-glucose 4-epimerase